VAHHVQLEVLVSEAESAQRDLELLLFSLLLDDAARAFAMNGHRNLTMKRRA
jgi:hypothetical protein